MIGTIGDIESMPFVEALRQLQLKVQPENMCLVHVSMVPTVGDSGKRIWKTPTIDPIDHMREISPIYSSIQVNRRPSRHSTA